jgi:hypothetical protein
MGRITCDFQDFHIAEPRGFIEQGEDAAGQVAVSLIGGVQQRADNGPGNSWRGLRGGNMGGYVGLVLLFSTETGEFLAIFPDGVMQRLWVDATRNECTGAKTFRPQKCQNHRNSAQWLALYDFL